MSAGLVRALLGLTILMAAGEPALAQPYSPVMRIETTNGRFWNGRILNENNREIVVQTAGGVQVIPRGAIRQIIPVPPPSVNVDPGASTQAAQARAIPVAALPRLRPNERDGALRLSGEAALATQLVPALLAAYGQDAGLIAVREEMAPDRAERLYRIEGSETERRVRALVRAQGTMRAFADLAANRTDLGMAARRIENAELRGLQNPGAGALRQPELEQVVALSGVAIIVHRDNPVRLLGVEQLRDLLSGAITRWSDVGGLPLPVTVYALDESTDATELVRDRIMAGARVNPRAQRFADHEDLADALAADPAGIGFVSVAHVRNGRPVGLRLSCGLTFEATPFQLRSEEYPLAQRMYLYASARTPPLGRDFLAYAVSDRAQPVVAGAGFINFKPLIATPAETAHQLAAAGDALPADLKPIAAPQVAMFRQIVAGAQRLSITFRFEAGRVELDTRAEADIGRLAGWTRQTENAGKSLLLLGHASADGAFATNVALSRARAQSVATRLQALGVPVGRVESVGPVSPVACPGSAGEADLNRRVEVWVK